LIVTVAIYVRVLPKFWNGARAFCGFSLRDFPGGDVHEAG
jgi:hypothetical protein